MKKVNIKELMHSRLFKVICGVVIVLLILVLYNCVVRENRDSNLTPEQQEAIEMEKAELKDTFDVVGDYLFPPQKHSADELLTDDEREARNNGDKKTDEKITETHVETVSNAPSEDDIVESADLRSDVHKAPAAPPPAEPSVEKVESPKVTPIE